MINKFFFNLTMRNWGAPWHLILACLATQVFISVASIQSVWEWYFGLYSLLLMLVATGYEVWQLSRGEETRQGAAEDLIMALLGYLIAIIPLFEGSWYYLVHLAMIPLMVPDRKRPLVCLDPGHGGKFTGVIAGGILESLVNFRYAHRLGNILRDLGFEVFFTRISDQLDRKLSTDLNKRADLANRVDADLFISLHCNAAENPSAAGFEIWTSKGETDADRFADAVFKAVSEAIPDLKLRFDISDGDNDKEKDFVVLRKTKMPAILIELGFLTNDRESTKLLSYDYTEKLCAAIANGIDKAFNDDYL